MILLSDVDRSSVALFGARILSQVLGFVSVVYFARQLGAAGLGIYFTFQTVVSIAAVFSKFGVPGAVVKRISQTEDRDQRGAYLSGSFVLVAVPFTIISLLLVVLRGPLDGYVGLTGVGFLLVLVISISNGSRLLVSALRGENRVAVTAGIELLAQVVRIVTSVVLLTLGFGVVGLIYGLAASAAIQAVVAYVLVETRFSLPTLADVRHLFDFSRYTAGMNVSNLAYSWTDTLVLAAFASKAVVGVYQTTWSLTFVTLFAAQAIGISLAPNVTRWHENGELGKVEAAFTQGVTYALALVIPAVVGAAVLGGDVLHTLYGYDAIGAGAVVLVALMVGQLAEAVKNITQNTLFGIDRPRAVFSTNMLSLAANVALNVLLVPQFGMLGAAAATVTTATIACTAQLYYLRRELTVTIDTRNLAWQTGFALLMGGVVLALSRVIPPTTVPGLVTLVVAGAGVYGIGLLTNTDIRTRLANAAPI